MASEILEIELRDKMQGYCLLLPVYILGYLDTDLADCFSPDDVSDTFRRTSIYGIILCVSLDYLSDSFDWTSLYCLILCLSFDCIW